MLIDVDDGLASEPSSMRRRRTAPRGTRWPAKVVDLRASSWDLDDHVLTALGLGPSGVERVVESSQELGVAASVDIWADGGHKRADDGTALG